MTLALKRLYFSRKSCPFVCLCESEKARKQFKMFTILKMHSIMFIVEKSINFSLSLYKLVKFHLRAFMFYEI